MFHLEKTVQTLQMINGASAEMRRLCAIPIVTHSEEADLVLKGIDTLKTMKESDWRKLADSPIEDASKSHPDEAIRAALQVMLKSFKVNNDAISGKSYLNESIIRSKSLHTDGLLSGNAIRNIDEVSAMFNSSDIDAGYLSAYRVVDARGALGTKVVDMVGQIRFHELKDNEEPIMTPLGEMKSDEIGLRKFGGGFVGNTYMMQNSVLTVNNFLEGIRVASANMRANVAYKELFMADSGINKQTPVTGSKAVASTGNDDAFAAEYVKLANARITLNEAARIMMNRALNVRDDARKKKDEDGEAPLTVSMATPILFLYNPVHSTFVNKMIGLTGNAAGIPASLDYNFVFVPTHLAPMSGGWTLDAKNDRDYAGAFGTVKDYGNRDDISGMLVYPQMRNVMTLYQDLTFASSTDAVSETQKFAAYERYNVATDVRQKTHVKLV